MSQHTDPSALPRMTRADIAAVMRRVPGLNDFGIGLFTAGRELDAGARAEELARNEAGLLESEESCTRVCGWLRDKGRRKTINVRRSSYGLKHLAEEEIGYITNGAFIAAAIHSGFRYRLIPGSPNVGFGISEKSLRVRAQVVGPAPASVLTAAHAHGRPASSPGRRPAETAFERRLHGAAPALLALAKEHAGQLAAAVALVPCTGPHGVGPCVCCELAADLARINAVIAEVEGLDSDHAPLFGPGGLA